MHVKELLSLKGKVCLVTGGAGRYGKCIVEGLAEADGTVITASRNLAANEAVAREFRELGLDVHARQLDQGDHDSVAALRENLAADFGGLDVFVNNSVARTMKGYRGELSQFEESMRIPFLVRWKGKIKPRRDDLLLSTPDIYPTLLDLMGFGEAIPKQVEGVSLAKVFLTGKGERPASQLYMRANPQQPQYGPRGVRTHDWKLVAYPGESFGELYDLGQDPDELYNLYDSPEAQTARGGLYERLAQWYGATRMRTPR